jgi:hypothetical protein
VVYNSTVRIGYRSLCLNILLACLLAAANVIAQDSSGMVTASRGEVSVTSDGETRPLKRGDFIHEFDEIIASERSFAVLQFVDGAKVSLRPDSALIIERYHYSSGGEDAATLSLVTGGMRVVVGAIASGQPGNYKIRTPLALLSIQGTEGSLTLCDDEICEQEGLTEIPE